MTRTQILWYVLAIIGLAWIMGIFKGPKQPDESAPEQPAVQQAIRTPEEIGNALKYCLMPKAQYGQYSSYDGGKSAGALLENGCPTEFTDWMDSCQKETRADQETCFTRAMILSQAAIKSFGK